jgi:hypothetical protein
MHIHGQTVNICGINETRAIPFPKDSKESRELGWIFVKRLRDERMWFFRLMEGVGKTGRNLYRQQAE